MAPRDADPGAAGRRGNPRLLVVPAQQDALGAWGHYSLWPSLVGMAGIAWKWREAERERTKAEAINELLTRRLLAGASLRARSPGQEPDGARADRSHRGTAWRLAPGSTRTGSQIARDNRQRLSLAGPG